MTEAPPPHPSMTERERIALSDIGNCSCPYIWRQASMLKLEARGYLERTGIAYGGAIGWRITRTGREALNA